MRYFNIHLNLGFLLRPSEKRIIQLLLLMFRMRNNDRGRKGVDSLVTLFDNHILITVPLRYSSIKICGNPVLGRVQVNFRIILIEQ